MPAVTVYLAVGRTVGVPEGGNAMGYGGILVKEKGIHYNHREGRDAPRTDSFLIKEFLHFPPFILLMLIKRDCDFLCLGILFFQIRTLVILSSLGLYSLVISSQGFPFSLLKIMHKDSLSPFHVWFFSMTLIIF